MTLKFALTIFFIFLDSPKISCNSCNPELSSTSLKKLQINIMFLYLFLGAILISAILFLKFILVNKKSIKNNKSIIFCGTRDSGKTTLLARVVNGKIDNSNNFKTQTSQNFNVHPWRAAESTKTEDPQTFKLIDIPGHERIRIKELEKCISDTKALIFVIDAEKVRDDVRDSAEYFVNILSNPILYPKISSSCKLNILIICNKQDVAMAKSANAIKKMLENEIQILKEIEEKSSQNSAAQLKATSQLDNNDAIDVQKKYIKEIFFRGDKFRFENLEKFDVEFVETSCVQDNDSYSFRSVDDWLKKQTVQV